MRNRVLTRNLDLVKIWSRGFILRIWMWLRIKTIRVCIHLLVDFSLYQLERTNVFVLCCSSFCSFCDCYWCLCGVPVRIMFIASLDFSVYWFCVCVSACVFVPPAVECMLNLATVWTYKEEHQQTLESRNLLSIKVYCIQVPSTDTYKKYMMTVRR